VFKINEKLADHGSDYEKIVELEAQLKAVQEERGRVEQEWLELAEQVPDN
jgi:ABC transport system ATP-binding/permease protein